MGGFAGGNTTMERRRRLMSAEELAQSDAILGEYGIVLPAPELASAPPNLSTDQLLHRLISVRIWKHISIILPLLALIAGLSVYAAAMPATTAADRSSIAVWHRGLENVSGVLCLLSGQLCVIISWVRSRSAIDFRGRYRIWGRFAVLLAGGGILMTTGVLPYLDDLLAMILQPLLGQITAAKPALVIVPTTAVAAVILFRVLFDMSRNRAGQGLLATATVLLVLAIASSLRTSGAGPDSLLPVIVPGAAGLLFSACLLHCRFVVHRNNDPPKSAPAAVAKELSAVTASPGAMAAESNVASLVSVSVPEPKSVAQSLPCVDEIEVAGGEQSAEKAARSIGKKQSGKSSRRKVA